MLNAALWNFFVGALLQNIGHSSLMSFQYVKHYDTPSWLKLFLFTLKIDKLHEFNWLCSKDPYKEVQAREGAFYARDCSTSDVEIRKFILFSLN